MASMEITIAFFVSLLMTGLVAGLFEGTQLGQLRVQQDLEAREFTFFKRRFELSVGGIMPPVLIVTTLSPAPLLFLLWGSTGAALLLTAVAQALWIAATVVTLILNVPVNNQAKAWNPEAPPADWAELRRKWHLGQTLRTPLTVAAFGALLAAALFGR